MTAILQRPRERVPRSVHYRDEETCETDPLRWSAAAPPPWAAALAAGSLSPPSPQLKDLTASLLSILKQLHDAGYFTLPVPLSSPPLSLSLDVEDTLPIIANAALYEDVEFMVCHHLYPDIKSFVGHMRRLLATAWRLDLTSAPKELAFFEDRLKEIDQILCAESCALVSSSARVLRQRKRLRRQAVQPLLDITDHCHRFPQAMSLAKCFTEMC